MSDGCGNAYGKKGASREEREGARNVPHEAREKREEKTREAKEIRVKLGQWGFSATQLFFATSREAFLASYLGQKAISPVQTYDSGARKRAKDLRTRYAP